MKTSCLLAYCMTVTRDQFACFCVVFASLIVSSHSVQTLLVPVLFQSFYDPQSKQSIIFYADTKTSKPIFA